MHKSKKKPEQNNKHEGEYFLMKIYTKTGDDGTTGLIGNKRVLKNNSRIISYGSVDELNAMLGLVLTDKLDDDIKNLLITIQNQLFIAGADLSNPNLEDSKIRITPDIIENIENNIDKFELELPPLTNFVLPGGNSASSRLHLARTIARRAESNIVSLMKEENINQNCLKYMNRLSDLFFVLARVVNKRSGIPDTIWKP